MSSPVIRPEGPTSEWKEVLPRPERMAKTICAFANSAGGELWIGVADDGRVVGVESLDDLRQAFETVLRWVQPLPKYHWERVRVGEQTVVRVRIERLPRGVASVGPVGSEERTVYVREGATNRPASTRTVRDLVADHRVKLSPKDRELLRTLAGSKPQSLPELAKKLRMGERRARRLLIPLLRAGLIHDREGRRYALTARGSARL